MKRRLILIGITGLVACLLLVYDYLHFMQTPLPLRAPSQILEIPAGASLRSVAAKLNAQGLLSRPLYWRAYARMSGKAHKIKRGEYELRKGINAHQLLDQLISGVSVQYQLTLLEGWSFAQISAAIKAHPQIKSTLTPAQYGDIMSLLGAPQMRPEGWFYPDTYRFPKQTTDIEFLRRSYQTMQRVLDAAWADRDQDLPLKTPYEALILASIVEKETGAAEERPLIAAVFLRRLQKGMRLQTDPTVIYGMGARYNGNIRKSDLQRDTPYNTYTRGGLPPTPIASPSGDAIRAVLHPAQTKALYFVASGGGRHYFSETYEEHRKAVIRYLLGGNQRRYRGQ